ncbi:RING finger protein [Phakopsora pachyrhizi]|uniref:RBR-type E3 ubiquitin transferase n=1 Tax=Phakopsora pachyrhizi TaxID=170000 RepID=A0AAV0AE28_PHAPC|nr:RING finger protein [Phakopsora pachyrhizi]CAH7666110.1 RING finger protein [Phakopsora pachyrhizi]
MSSDTSDIDMEYDSTCGYEEDEDVLDLDSNDVSSDEDAVDDDGSGFDVLQNTSRTQKPLYQVEYKVLNEAELTERQVKEIEHVAGIIGIETKDAALVLRYFGWNKDLLMEKYMDFPEKVFRDAGVRSDNGEASKLYSGPRRKNCLAQRFVCQICFNDEPNLPTIHLPSCPPLPSTSTSSSQLSTTKHEFCRDCYTQYIQCKIIEGESRTIECMESECKQIVDESTIIDLLSGLEQCRPSGENFLERYQTLLNRTFVDDNPALKFCPAPNCVYAVECHVSKRSLDTVVPSVTCLCGHRFCFGCGLPDHQPCICPIVKMWLQKCEDDSETANWISANTKECPKCHSTIEKNGGCNHMTCKKCKYEFCWVCTGVWSDHGTAWYSCNKFEERADTGKDQQSRSRASLERYLHYYNRFANHEQSLKLDRELHARTERKMEEIQQSSNMSWIEVQFLNKAVETLTVCRTTLKWTYAMAFYLEKNNFTALFEDNQSDLESAVEELSGLLEENITPETIADLRQKVTDRTVYVSKRNEIMLAETARDYQDGRIYWNS